MNNPEYNRIYNIFFRFIWFVYLHRWQTGFILCAVLTYLQIHGSSIGIYAYFLGVPQLDTSIWGVPRLVRLDEWGVFTPIAFSQYYDGGGGNFSCYSQIVRGTATNVAILFGQPCWSFITLFRPSLWGFLLFPQGPGLAFFWDIRLIILFLASFEFGLIIARKKKFAFVYAFMMVFSPIVQWWFATNNFVEMLVFGQLGLVFILKYITTISYKWRFFYGASISYCVLGYIFTIYPAWQIPFAYVFLCIAIWIVFTHKKDSIFSIKDIILISVFAIITITIIVEVFSTARDLIEIIKASEYPGKRFSVGGTGEFRDLFRYFYMFSAPYYSLLGYSPLEDATYISFFPIGFCLALWERIRKNNRDTLIWGLIGLSSIFCVFCFIAWPTALVKLLLLYEVPVHRIIVAIDYMQLIVLIRVLSYDVPDLGWKKLITIILAYIFVIYGNTDFSEFGQYSYIFFDFSIVLLVLSSLVILKYKRIFIITMITVCFLTGMTINPISRGVQSIYQTDLAQNIINITKEDKGVWVVDGQNVWNTNLIWCMNDYPIMFGAPTINSFNTYVCWNRWNAFNLTDTDRIILNRCGHMNITLTNEEKTTFQCPRENQMTADLVNILLNVHDLSKLEVSYILTHRELEQLSDKSVSFVLESEGNGFKIYKVQYH